MKIATRLQWCKAELVC